MRTLITIALGLCLSGAASAADISAAPGDYTIEDGQTIVVNGKKIRLAHIVVPTLGAPCLMRGKERDCGLISRSSLLDLSAGAVINCEVDAAGLGRCSAGGFDLAEQIVYTGWAVPVEGAPKRYWKQLKISIARGHGFWKAKFVPAWPPKEAAVKR